MQLTIPDILRKIRLDRKLSQENIAEEINVDATTYGRYEKGESQIKFEQVAQIASFYKLTLDEFYHYGDSDFKVAEPLQQYPKRSKVTVMVELDGRDSTLNEWMDRLTKLNKAI